MFRLFLLLGFTVFSFATIEDSKTEATGVKAPCEHCGVNVSEVQLEENTNCNNHLLPDEMRCHPNSATDKNKKKSLGIR